MSRPKYLTSPPEQTTMPAGIPYIVGNEAAERFSFYGMKTVLAIFTTKFLLDAAGQHDFMSDAESSKWIHNFNTAVYAFPIVGAIFSDWLWGKYRTILSLSLLYCVGHAILALMDVNVSLGISQRTLLWWGLACIAVGAGGIKPCVSAHVGDQFGRSNQYLVPIIFGWFYFSINFGSTFSTILTPWLRETYGPSWAFAVPGILMGLATLVFWMGRNKFVHVPPSGKRFFNETISRDGLKAVGNLVPLYFFIAPFWALFDQTSSRWVLQAEHMDRHLLGWNITPDQLQVANPIMVMLLIPVFTYGAYPAFGRLIRLTPLRKIGIGLFVTLPSFLLVAWIETRIVGGVKPHVVWQLLAYLFITIAEVLVSITSLEFSYTQAPNEMKSFIMGLYLLSVAFGNLFTAGVNWVIEISEKSGSKLLEGANYYLFFAACMAVTAVLYVLWAPWYRGKTYIQESQRNGESQEGLPAYEV